MLVLPLFVYTSLSAPKMTQDRIVTRRNVLKIGASALGGTLVGGSLMSKKVAANLGSGRVGHYTLNSLGGRDRNVVRDSSPAGNNGTNYGATVVKGQVGNAFEFDGNDYVDLGTQLTQGFTTMTVAAWIRTSAGGDRVIVERGVWNDDDGFALFVDIFGRATWGHWGDNGANNAIVSSTVSVRDGTWHHVAGTLEPVGSEYKYTLYIDGAFNKSNTSYRAVTASTEPTGIGRRIPTSNNYYFDGRIDEVRIYDRALSADEVESLYQMAS